MPTAVIGSIELHASGGRISQINGAEAESSPDEESIYGLEEDKVGTWMPFGAIANSLVTSNSQANHIYR